MNYKKNILKWRKESDTYQTHVCRHRWSRQITMQELSASTMAFISCRGRVYICVYSWWKPQCWLKAPKIYPLLSWSVCSSDAYRHKSGRCRSFSFILIYFLSFNLSRFSFYIKIDRKSHDSIYHIMPPFVCCTIPKS